MTAMSVGQELKQHYNAVFAHLKFLRITGDFICVKQDTIFFV